MIGAPITLSQKRVYRVQVEVSYKADDTMNSLIKSYIKRELRSLGDVEVVNTNPEFQIIIVGKTDHTKGGRDLGYSLAVAYTTRHTVPSFVLRKDISDWMKSTYLSPVYVLEGLIIMGGERENLQSVCQETVADLDTKMLEPLRRVR